MASETISTPDQPVKGKRMSGIFLNSEEMKAMDELHPLHELLYRQIRKSMNYQDGTCGIHSKISWQGLADRVSRKGSKGIGAFEVTVNQARRAATHLEKIGLIQIVSIKGPNQRLVIKCLIAGNPTAQTTQELKQEQRLRLLAGGKADSVQKKADSVNSKYPTANPTAEESQQNDIYQQFNEWQQMEADSVPGSAKKEKPTNNKDTRLDKICNTRTREKIAPEHFMELVDYFTTLADFKFPNHKVHTASNVPRFKSWIDMNATFEEIETAIEVAHTQLGGPPASPAYYDKVLKSLRNTQDQQKQEDLCAKQNPTIKTTGGRHHAKPTTDQDRRRIFESGYHPDQNRKLTPAERSRVAYGTDPDTLRKFDEQEQYPGYDDAIDGQAWAIE